MKINDGGWLVSGDMQPNYDDVNKKISRNSRNVNTLEITHQSSPNADDRPADTAINLLVIHNISLPPGVFGQGYVQQFFCNNLDKHQHSYFESIAHLRVSAHLLIERSGHITQFVPFQQRAWHAGISRYGGREACNDFSIGIELEGTDIDAYTGFQYQQLRAVTAAIMLKYPLIDVARIVSHADIAPVRKTDPGLSFDWHHYLSLLATDSSAKPEQ